MPEFGISPFGQAICNAYLVMKHACWYTGILVALTHGMLYSMSSASTGILASIDQYKNMKPIKNGISSAKDYWIF